MTKRFFVLSLTMILAVVSAWAADEVYDFKGLNTTAGINRGESLGFTVNNGSNRTIYSFSIEGVDMDCSRFGAFIGGADDANIGLKTSGLLLKGRILSVLNLNNGDKVKIDYLLASGGTLTLADATLIGNTTDNTFESGTEYTISTTAESVHLDIISSSNNNYIQKVTITPAASGSTNYTVTSSVTGNGTVQYFTNGSDKDGQKVLNEFTNETTFEKDATVELVAVPDAGYQLKEWQDKDGNPLNSLSKSFVNAVTMPEGGLTVKAVFEQQPAQIEGITTAKTWYFSDFTSGTLLSDDMLYYYDGLYVKGHSDTYKRTSTYAKIDSKSSQTIEFDDNNAASNTLYLSNAMGAVNSNSVVNGFINNSVAFYAGVPGTVYVKLSGTYKENDLRNLVIYSTGDDSKIVEQATTGSGVVTISGNVSAGNIFIGTSKGSCNIYAIAFVPASVTKPVATATTEPAAKESLTFNGAEQDLITAGESSEGTVNYATTEEGEYSTTIPKATNAGEYDVWWKIVADDSHTDKPATKITVTIGKYDITNATAVNAIEDQTYTGSALTPEAPAIKMGDTTIDAENYDVDYSDNTEVGTATVTYTAKEGSTNFTGTKTLNFTIVVASSPSGDAVPVFLTAGQSNTAGRCMNENLPDYIKTLGTNNNNAYQYCNWSYTNGSTRKSESEGVFRKFWPEMESSSNSGRFAYDAIVYYWIEQALQKDFYVVKHAQGGTSIDPSCSSTNDYHWSADATWLAEHASCNTEGGTSMLKAFCDNIGASLDALTTDGKAYDIKAMIWHQGESDRSGTGPDNYHDNLQAVVQYVRDYLVTKTGDNKYATLDFICGTVPTNSKQYNKKVYDALFTLAQEDSHFHVIETSPGTFIGDQLHFDTNCAERLGIGMYNKMVDLGLVSGTKQTVPEVIYPEGQPVTLDFKTWATENVGANNQYQNLILDSEAMSTLDGTTTIYKAIGCEAEADFSEFAETFAIADTNNKVRMRGNVGLQLTSGNVTTFSILNLNPGDGVTITFGAGTSGATTLAALSENIFVSDDATQTVLAAGTALTSKTVTYVVKSGTQIDLTFGSTGGHYINSIVITPDVVEILPTKPTVTLKTDGAEEKVYTVTFLEGETLHYTSPDATEEQTVTYSTDNNGSVDITVTKAGDLVCWTTRGTGTTESAKNTTTVTFSSGDEPTTAITIHTIGDSTMSSYDQSIPAQAGMDGWGDYLIDCMKTEWVTVNNWADRGETAKSYYNGIWNKTSSDRPEFLTPIAEKVNAGDYVIIQFGHNDSKAYDTATYEEWLGTLVDAVKAKGATPIMAGSICRARFDSNGKITRLGRIDTGEENGVGEDDHTYDYPYHAKQVATAKGIEFIDVTSGVKDMFETYGEAKTKALFPSGEKTHTNKLGAQLIAKVAAKLLLNTAIANYVDQETLALPDVDDIDVVIDDFGSEATVTKKTIWTFNDVEVGAAISDGNNEIVNRNGLYVRGRADARAINAVASTLTSVTFSDNTEQTVSVVAQTAGANTATESTIGQNTAGRAAANGLAPMFALNIATPGTFYAIMAPTKKAADRNINLFFSGKLVDSKVINDVYDATTDHLCELKYHAETTGVIYIAAGIASNLYAAMFIPDMEAGTEEDWNYQMLKTRENGWWTYTNMSGNNQSVPEGLTAYAVKEISDAGKAVLAEYGSVIANGAAVLVKGEANTEYALPSTTEEATYNGTNLLVANTTLRYLPATENDNTNYYFDGEKFVKATGGETIHEKQAYLNVASTAENILLPVEGEVTLNVTLDGTRRWATYYSDKHLAKPVGVTAYRVASVEGNTVNVEEVDYIKAHTGVLLYSETAVSEANLTVAPASGTDYTSELLGTVVAGTMTAGINYVLYNNQFILAEDTTLPANRCYLHLADSSPLLAPQLTIAFDGNDEGTTSIGEVSAKMEEGRDLWYTLDGRKLQGKPSKKGLYIVNGKKAIVK